MNMLDFSIKPRTLYEIECWRDGKLIWEEVFPNVVTNDGRTRLLEAAFRSGIGANGWFIGIVDDAGWTGYSANDTMILHNGWVENTDYDETTRPQYTPDAAAGQSIANAAFKGIFTMNATLTIRGAFLVDDDTPGDTAGTLYGVGDFTIPRSIIPGDVIAVKITISD